MDIPCWHCESHVFSVSLIPVQDGCHFHGLVDYRLSVGLYGGGAMSDVVLISAGAPQLTVLSPFLFTFHCCEKRCSDDTAVGGCIRAGWSWSAGK